MKQTVGWAEPRCVISAPRVQKVEGFYYQYLESKDVHEMEVGIHVVTMRQQMQDAYRAVFGPAAMPPILAMFIDVPGKTGRHDVQIGFAVEANTPPLVEAKARFVAPALIAGMIVGGDIDAVVSTYGTLTKFMDENRLKGVAGWREWYLHWENDTSLNSITWVMHDLEETV